MAKLLLVVNLFFAIVYVNYGADAAHLRSRRSCDPCQNQQTQSLPRHLGPPLPPYDPPPFGPPPFGPPPFGPPLYGPPPPPPYGPPAPYFRPHPPPFLRTQNWSGYHRAADGSQQGVFSGAAAESGTSDQAYSLASSDVGTPEYSRGYDQSFVDTKHSEQRVPQYRGESNEGYSSYQLQNNVDSKGQPTEYTGSYGKPGYLSSAQAQSSSYSGTYGPSEKNQNFENSLSRSHEREQQFTQQSGNDNGGYLSYQSENKGVNKDSQGRQTEYTRSYGHPGYSSSAQALSSSSSSNLGASENDHNYGNSEAVSHETKYLKENAGYAHQEISESQHLSSDNNYNHVSSNDNAINDPNKTGADESVQSTLKGALDLASQGLQTQSSQGCTTCQIGSLAFSNAKTNQGSAVAVSIGG